MLRVGIITATYRPSINGVAISTELIVKGLRSHGHDVRVFVPANPDAADEQGVYRLPSTRFGAPADYPVMLPPTARTTSQLPIEDLDVIHTMHPFIAGHTGLAWASRLKVPILFTAHTQYHDYAHYAPLPSAIARRLIRNHVRRFAQRVDMVLAPGTAMVEALRGYGYRGHVEIVPNPVDLSRFASLGQNDIRARHGVPAGAQLLLYVGRIASEKNLPLLLQAFEQIKDARKDAYLLLVGDGPLRQALERDTDRSDILFAGAVSNADVPRYLAAADVFVSPSLTETGAPLSFLEAFAAGVPVVSVGGRATTCDVVAHEVNGLICKPDAQELSRQIMRLLEEPSLLRALGQGARASAAQYSVDARARDMSRIYQRLLQERGARREPGRVLTATGRR